MRTIIFKIGTLVLLFAVLFTACNDDLAFNELENIEQKEANGIVELSTTIADSLAPNQRVLNYKFPFSNTASEIIVEVDEHGNYVAEGDMILATKDEIGEVESRGIAISYQSRRWPNAVIPYKIESGHYSYNRIMDAIKHVNEQTSLRLIPRTNQSNYVEFVEGDKCWAFVGKKGGRQEIILKSSCSFGSTVHEILHAAGLWHEQSRSDRNDYITVNYNNIESGKSGNFSRHTTDGIDLGPYNFNSIMHYGTHGFSKNGQPTIEVKPQYAPQNIGQRVAMSYGDVDAINAIYPYASSSPFAGKFTGVYRKSSQDTKRWLGADWSNFNAKRSEMRSNGYRLFDVEVYVKNGKLLYDGLFEKYDSNHAFYQYSSWSAFTNKRTELKGQGYYLVDLETTYFNGKRYYTGVFHKKTGKTALYAYNNWTSFTNKWDELSKEGYRLIDIETYKSGSNRFYIGVYVGGSGGYGLYNTTSWNAFKNTRSDLAKDGIYLIDFERVKIGSNAYRYLGVFQKKSTSSRLWHNVRWDSFKFKTGEYNEDGYELRDIERY